MVRGERQRLDHWVVLSEGVISTVAQMGLAAADVSALGAHPQIGAVAAFFARFSPWCGDYCWDVWTGGNLGRDGHLLLQISNWRCCFPNGRRIGSGGRALGGPPYDCGVLPR